MRIPAILAALVIVIAANLAVWALPNQPYTLDPLPEGRIKSVSFAPFRNGQSPLTKVYPTPGQIGQDIAAVSAQVQGVRTYTSIEGLEIVPRLAQRHGLKVIQGAWLSSRLDKNEDEIGSAIRLANEYPDTVSRIIVGNEVLLRGELKPAQIKAYLRRVRAAVKQPVGYADVWEYWLKYPEMAGEVDFIAIHLLPYWEDVPAGVEDAAQAIVHAYRKIAERFPGKPILVGEAGWPTAGRTRGPAEPGLVNKARFINAFVNLAERNHFDYNLIEAFDQNWKARLEGTVGGHWGLYDTDRRPKFPLTGAVVENPRWPVHFGLSTALALGILALVAWLGPALPAGGFLGVALLVQGMSSAFVHAAVIAATWNYYIHDIALGLAMLALQAVAGAGIVAAALRFLSGTGPTRHGYVPLTDNLRAAASLPGRVALLWGNRALLAMTVVAVVWTILLTVDGRYRDFPVPDYVVPVFGLLVLGLCRLVRSGVRRGETGAGGMAAALSYGLMLEGGRLHAPHAVARGLRRTATLVPWECVSVMLLVLGAAAIVVAEGPHNREALVWAGLQIGLAMPYAATMVLAKRGVEPR